MQSASHAGAASAPEGQRSEGESANWGDPDATGIAELISRSRANGWRKEIAEIGRSRPFFSKRLLDFAQGNWHLLAGIPRDGTALDVGCGFGSLVLGLSTHFRTVLGIDMLLQRLALSRLRADQDGVAHAFFARSSGFQTPFRPETFDLVTLHGVLEWAAYYTRGEPRSLQLSMLAEARRVLKATGTLAVAIENRYAAESLVGMRDTHTQIRFITMLPRWLANILARSRTGLDYRTYLYGRSGYEKLFRDAGYRSVRILDLVSSYNDYQFVVAPGDAETYRFLWSRDLISTFYPRAGKMRRRLSRMLPRALGEVSYAYLILAGDSSTCMLDADHEIWKRANTWGVGEGVYRFACKGTGVGTMVLVAHDGSAPLGFIEYGVGLDATSPYPTVLHPAALKLLGEGAKLQSTEERGGIIHRTFRYGA